MKSWVGKLKSPALQGLSRAAHGLLRAQGYRLELRRSGELKLGLWRKSWRKPRGGQKVRRFVVLPGFGDTPLSWAPVVALLTPILRARFDEVVLFDFPGFQGGLAREKSFHSMDLLMEKTFDALDTLAPRALLGHSLGGWLGSRYVALCGKGDRPRTLKREGAGPELAIFADPSGVFGNDALKHAWTERFAKVVEEGFHHLRPHVFSKEPFWFDWVISEFEAFARKEEILLFMKSVRDDHLVEELLPHVRAKVFLLWGERDTLTPPEFAPGWRRFLPEMARPEFVTLKDIGHSPHLEAPLVTAAALGRMIVRGIPAEASSGIAARLPSRLPAGLIGKVPGSWWSWEER